MCPNLQWAYLCSLEISSQKSKCVLDSWNRNSTRALFYYYLSSSNSELQYWSTTCMHGIHVDFLPFMHCFINPRLQSLMATSTCSSRPLSNKSSLGSSKCFLPFIKIPNVVCVYSLILQELSFPHFNASRCKCMVKPFHHVQAKRQIP